MILAFSKLISLSVFISFEGLISKKYLEVIIRGNGVTDGIKTEVDKIFIEIENEGWKRLKMIQSEVNLYGFTTRDDVLCQYKIKFFDLLSLSKSRCRSS